MTQIRRLPVTLQLGPLVAGLLLLMAVAAGNGMLSIPVGEVASAVFVPIGWVEATDNSDILWAIRFPRVVMAVTVGVGLAVSGALLQALFRNPLADPGLLGLSSGASVAVASVLYFVKPPAAWALPVAAFVGAMLASLLVLVVGRRTGRVDVASMLLTGIAVNAIGFAAVGLLMYLSDEATLRSLTFWTMGSLAGGTWPLLGAVALIAIPSLIWALFQGQSLNALLLGEAEAAHLGVDVGALKIGVVVASSLMVGAAVASAGMIGFIGLVVPHLCRMAFGPDMRRLLPLAAVVGPLLLLSADLIARIVVAPTELPVGVLTTLLGAPIFLWLLRSGR